MINQFITDLSPAGRKIFAVAAFVVILALFDRLLLTPTLAKLEQLNQKVSLEEDQIKQDLRFLARKDNVAQEAKSFDAYYTDKIPTEEELTAAFLKKVEGLATQAGVTLGKINPSGQDKQEYYIKYTVDVECSGLLENVVTFMHAVDSTKELLRVEKFNIASKRTDTDEIKATMTISKMLMSSRLQPIDTVVPGKKDQADVPSVTSTP